MTNDELLTKVTLESAIPTPRYSVFTAPQSFNSDCIIYVPSTDEEIASRASARDPE